MRTLRKSIYRLERADARWARWLLALVLWGYRGVDRLVLRRATRMDLASEKVVSHDQRFLCVVVPKSGSRTLIAGLDAAARLRGFDLTLDERSIEAFLHGYEGYTTFAVVRDPWSRIYSCYKQKLAQATPITKARTLHGRRGLHASMSFDAFVRWLATHDGRDDVADRHWMSQTKILGMDRGMTYDFIGRLDAFDEALEAIAERIGIPTHVFAHELRTARPDEYLAHYTPALVRIVAERYADDVERFGFVPPDLPSPPD
ncbi:MAG: sulfotransferase family 2 domain-containing protein [Trueperaceae bacterium]|nr:sulfotransferase family 2 domain-containing protein [Trueperaceae bacterium]